MTSTKLLSAMALTLTAACGSVSDIDADSDAGPSGSAPLAMSGEAVTVIGVDVSAQLQATDADNDLLTYAFASQPTSGMASLDGDSGRVVYTPNAGFVGTDSFEFTASDGESSSAAATITITVHGRTDGKYDTGFGNNGLVASDFLGVDSFSAVALQDDGAIVCVGGSASQIIVARYSSAGALDSSFGTSGSYVNNLGAYSAFNAVVVQDDGKILVGGQVLSGSRSFALSRLDSEGKLDTGFGNDGLITTTVGTGGSSAANAMLVQSDGKIVLAGYGDNTADDDFALVRYSAGGTLDTSFGTMGIALLDFGTGNDRINEVVEDADGNLVAVGYAATADGQTLAVARFSAEGVLDTSFGSNGMYLFTDSGSSAVDATLDSRGGVVVVGSAIIQTSGGGIGNTSADAVALRFGAAGSLDSGFGSGGVALVPASSHHDGANAVIEQFDGTLLLVGVAGTTPSPSDFSAMLVRLSADGVPDTSFGPDGVVINSIGASDSDRIADAVMQPDGKVIAVGWDRGADLDAALLRFGY